MGGSISYGTAETLTSLAKVNGRPLSLCKENARNLNNKIVKTKRSEKEEVQSMCISVGWYMYGDPLSPLYFHFAVSISLAARLILLSEFHSPSFNLSAIVILKQVIRRLNIWGISNMHACSIECEFLYKEGK